MKRLLLILSLVLTSCSITFAQQQYTVNGQTITLKTEVEGTATLLWNIIDGAYHYYVKKDGAITQLENTKVDGKYREEYKETLSNLTADSPASTDKVKFTLAGLKTFLNAYNLRVDPAYSDGEQDIRLKLRFGPFAGISNAIFTDNPTNTSLLVVGADLELIDEIKLRRHSVVMRFKQTIQNSEYKFNSSQLSLNYRFKFVKQQTFDVFINGKFVAYTYSSRDDIPNPNFGMPGQPEFFSASGGDLSAPATFGLGADIALGNGHLFVTYNDIVGIGVDSNGEFPMDITVGYKFGL